MKTLSYKKIDAFASDNSLGNPAACIYLDNEQFLTDQEMLTIAKQHKSFVSEVIYCKNINKNEFNLIYYSSECEVPFCGHGTIACAYSLIKNSSKLMELSEITIHTRCKGNLSIYNKIKEQDAVYISAPQPLYLNVPVSLELIAENLNIDKKLISNEYKIDFIDAGNKTLIVPIIDLNSEINIFPDEKTLKDFSLNNGIDVILIFCKEVKNNQHFVHTRIFAAKYGYLEDPATGSANSAFGYYMLKNKIWNGDPITIEQGGIDRVFNTVNLLYKNNKILFGGKASTRIDGVYYI